MMKEPLKPLRPLISFPFDTPGACPTQVECLLDPNAGVASLVGWSRFAFLDFLVLFYRDAQLAANLANSCQALQNVTGAQFNTTAGIIAVGSL